MSLRQLSVMLQRQNDLYSVKTHSVPYAHLSEVFKVVQHSDICMTPVLKLGDCTGIASNQPLEF